MAKKKGKSKVALVALALIGAVAVGSIATLASNNNVKHWFQSSFGLEVEHVYESDDVVTVDPTCKKAGSITKTCDICGEKNVEVLPKVEHVAYDSTIVIVPPTEDKNGSKTYTCSVCGEKIVEILFITGHTAVSVEGVAPTCTEDGLTSGVKCDVCGRMIVEQDRIPALGHDIDGSECTRCDYISLDALYPAGFEYVVPTIGEETDGQIYRLMPTENANDAAVCLGIKLIFPPYLSYAAFDLYGNKVVSLDSDISVSSYLKTQFFDFDGYRFVKLMDVNVAYPIVIEKIYTPSTVRCVAPIEYDTEYTLWNLPESEHMTLQDGVLSFNGTGVVSLTTKTTYDNFELTFSVDEVSDVRGAFQVGIGAETTETDIMHTAYVQFNYDRPVVVNKDGNVQDDYWANGQNWTLRMENGLLTLSCENGVICENVDVGVSTGHLILRAESSCALSIHNLRIVEL